MLAHIPHITGRRHLWTSYMSSVCGSSSTDKAQCSAAWTPGISHCTRPGTDSGSSPGWHWQRCGCDWHPGAWLAQTPCLSHLLFSTQNLQKHKSVQNSNPCQTQLIWPKGSEVSSCKRKGKMARSKWEECTPYEHKSFSGTQAKQEPVTVHARQGVRAEMGEIWFSIFKSK